MHTHGRFYGAAGRPGAGGGTRRSYVLIIIAFLVLSCVNIYVLSLYSRNSGGGGKAGEEVNKKVKDPSTSSSSAKSGEAESAVHHVVGGGTGKRKVAAKPLEAIRPSRTDGDANTHVDNSNDKSNTNIPRKLIQKVPRKQFSGFPSNVRQRGASFNSANSAVRQNAAKGTGDHHSSDDDTVTDSDGNQPPHRVHNAGPPSRHHHHRHHHQASSEPDTQQPPDPPHHRHHHQQQQHVEKEGETPTGAPNDDNPETAKNKEEQRQKQPQDQQQQGDHYKYNPKLWPYRSLEDMLVQHVPKRHYGPSRQDVDNLRHLVKSVTGCDLYTVPFNPRDDARCISYMTNASHWKNLRAVSQEYDQRTIKFEIDFEEHDLPVKNFKLQSLLKMPQKLFPNEAFSEVGAFHADRVLQVNRIPPTGWVCIPSRMIHDAVDHALKIGTVPEFLQESHVKTYKEWVDKDLFEYAKQKKGHILQNEGTHQECVGASIQLHVLDVHHLLDSALSIPYIPHNSSWHAFFDLHQPAPFNPLLNMAPRHAPPSSKNKKQDDGSEAAGNEGGKILPSSSPVTFFGKPYAPSLVHISEVSSFDFIVGNGDRSPNKNNFVVGGCVHRCSSTRKQSRKLLHPGHPTYIHLDQGMSFYETPRNSPITKSHSSNPTFCIFRAPLMNRLRHLSARIRHEKQSDSDDAAVTLFEKRMDAVLPGDVKKFVTKHTLAKCGQRIAKLLEKVDACLKQKEFADYVIVP